MLAFRMIIFVVGGLGLIVVIAAIVPAFLSTRALIKLHFVTDNWNLWPLNKVTAWVIEARQFRDRDG